MRQDVNAKYRVSTLGWLIAVLLMALTLFVTPCLSSKASALTLTVNTVTSNVLPGSNNALKMNSSNCSTTVPTSQYIQKKKYSDRTCVQIKYSHWTNGKTAATWTIKNPFTMTFSNAGTINGQAVDVIVKCTEVQIKSPKSSTRVFNDANWYTIAYHTATKPWIGGQSSVKDTKAFTVKSDKGFKQNSTIQFQIVKHGTSTVYPGTFTQVVQDIDQKAENEMWAPSSGFGQYFWHKDTELQESNGVFSHKNDNSTTGDAAEWKQTGVAGVTTGGTFTSKFTGGNCATALRVIYKSIPDATKTVNKSTASPGDKLTYTVSHTFGTFIKDTWSPYSSITITDQLDTSKLDLDDAVMKIGSSNAGANVGTLSKDNGKVTYTFKSDYLKDLASNYNGQTFNLVITATVKNDATGTITNQAIVNNSNVQSKPSVSTTLTELQGSFSLAAKKVLKNKDLNGDQFAFDVKNSDGEVIKSAKCDADGNVDFGTFNVGAPGTYEFTISEEDDEQGGIDYDTKESKVKVVVTQVSGTNDLNCVVTYDGSSSVPTFTNSYSASGTWEPSVFKVLKGADLKDGQFTFEILDLDGKVVTTGKSSADGMVDFDNLSFTDADSGMTYTYTIREVNDKQEDITYDDSTYTVKLTITDNGDGTLDFDAIYDDGQGNHGQPEFVNYALVYGDQLPVTGGEGWPYAGLGILLVVAGIAALRTRRSQYE